MSSCNLNNSTQIVNEGIEMAGTETVQKVNWEKVLPNNLNEEFQMDLEKLHQASVYTIDMEIIIDGAYVRVRGSEEIVYTNQESVPLEIIYFRLIPNVGGDYLAVSDVKIDGNSVEPTIEFNNTALRLDLQEPLVPGESTKITMNFDEVVPSVMGGNYGLYVYIDDILALDAFFPIIPVYNDEGWNIEEPPQNADMIFTDAAFFSVTVDAPKEFVLAAGGKETERVEKSDRQIVTFEGGPQRDFYLAASPRFVSESTSVDGVKVTSYFVEEFRPSGERVLEIGANALSAFSERFGSYPYNELDLVSTPMQAGGMEYSNIVAIGIYFYDPASIIEDTPGLVFFESTTAHEVAHEWFYCQVMSDQIDEPWLDESLVQYATYLYYLDTYGKAVAEGFKESFHRRWERVAKEPIPIGMPAKDYSPKEYGAIVYGRGALFFEALAEEMGQETFDSFLREYVDTFRWGIAEPVDLKVLAEGFCGCDLSQVFADWGVIY
jgi:aminopeptidase N